MHVFYSQHTGVGKDSANPMFRPETDFFRGHVAKSWAVGLSTISVEMKFESRSGLRPVNCVVSRQ